MPLNSVFPTDLLADVRRDFADGKNLTLSGIGNLSTKCFVVANLPKLDTRLIVWVVNDPGEMRALASHLAVWQERSITIFDKERADETEREQTIRLIRTAFALRERGGFLLTTYRDAQAYLPDLERLKLNALELKVGATLNRTEFFNDLITRGYEHAEAELELTPGSYKAIGSTIKIFPPERDAPVTIDLDGDTVEQIIEGRGTRDEGRGMEDEKSFKQIPNPKSKIQNPNRENPKLLTAPYRSLQSLLLLPIEREYETLDLLAALPSDALLIVDELILEESEETNSVTEKLPAFSAWLALNPDVQKIILTSFPDEETDFIHLRFLSVLKFVSVNEVVMDLRTKKENGWHVVIVSKQADELRGIFRDKNFIFSEQTAGTTGQTSMSSIESLDSSTGNPNVKIQRSNQIQNQNVKYEIPNQELRTTAGVTLIPIADEDFLPQAFQNPELKIALVTDREIFGFQRAGKSVSEQKVYLDFLTSLRSGDYVVHLDHGIGIFRGIEQKTVDTVTREYLRLDYAESDKLFVPIDQADKVNRFIGAGDAPPRLTRLGSAEWTTVTKRVAAETEKIAKELLALYAARAAATGHDFPRDGDKQAEFERRFPYEETPGQLRAIQDVKADMEAVKPMDRLVCGDVGFGKTEVALRAAFKAVMAGKQVAFISPITILTDQHYKTFVRRLEGLEVTCEMLSRFRTPAEQKKILEGAANGSIQIVIGTHRLLQPDVKFRDLGLVIIDEEQRFGVKQKEKLKELRNQVDLLTMTATPIPRTLNMALNKLRDITTITTPPPGRLPIVTEVRHFSWALIREAILTELKRGGQTYFLHNRVTSIDGIADKLRSLVPEARFVVTHGKLKPDELEDRIFAFKDGKFDVLVSSAIIENGIDLPNANTLIVNNADMFGLSQLYQLRGRVGRSRTQAYSYFLYHSKTLKTDAKKRLRAIVEASELGSGFDIAMKDLEIRGAGDILGANQSGAINTVGVSHFVRMLNQAVEDLKAGKQIGADAEVETVKKADVTLEVPLTAFIPITYISDTKEKIRAYQKLSAADNEDALNEVRNEITDEYGRAPNEFQNLVKVIRLKLACRRAGVLSVKVGRAGPLKREAMLVLGTRVKPANIMNALAQNPRWFISGDKLKIDTKKLGLDWMSGLQETVEALATEYRGDDVGIRNKE